MLFAVQILCRDTDCPRNKECICKIRPVRSMYLLFSMGYILRAGACIRDTYKRTDIQKGHVMIPITFILPVDAIPSLPDAPYVCILEYSYTPWFEQQNVEGAWVGENETKLKKKKKG